MFCCLICGFVISKQKETCASSNFSCFFCPILILVVVVLCYGLALSLSTLLHHRASLIGCCGRGNYMHKLAKWISLCFLSVRLC